MHLRALSIGYAVPANNFDANIHSVFSTAVNLKPAHRDLLLTLVVAGEADLPQGIRLNSPEDFPFEQLTIGGSVFYRDNVLIFENSPLRVDCNQGKRWQCDLQMLGIDLTKPAVVEAWRCVWKWLNECQVQLGAEIVAEALLQPDEIGRSIISQRVGESMRILIQAARNYQLDKLSALTGMIGLGTGLTPCGDDILVGYLAGLWCMVGNMEERRQFVSKLGQAVIYLSARTNDISRTYLYHAAFGQVSSRLYALAKAITQPDSPAQFLPIAESAIHTGLTSGMDAVTGLLLGLATWDGKKIFAFN